jgi:hypothetical protein
MSATATKATANGTGHEIEAFPVDSFRDAAKHLRRPFTRAAVKFKVQATFPKANPTRGLIVAYIDARLAVERLNLVVPHLWFDEYQSVGNMLMCRLTVDGITRHDIGEGYQGKGLYSDALKRAAVKFGVGVSLYAIPQTFLNVSDGHLKEVGQGDRRSLVLTPNGESRCRDIYGLWLDSIGTQAFGEPLDHGDVEGSQGDAEVPEHEVAHDAQAEPEVVESPIGPDLAGLLAEAGLAVVKGDKLQLAASHVFGGDVGDCSTVELATAAIARLTAVQASKLEEWIAKKAAPDA